MSTCNLSVNFRDCHHNNGQLQKVAAFPMLWTFVELFYSLYQRAVFFSFHICFQVSLVFTSNAFERTDKDDTNI